MPHALLVCVIKSRESTQAEEIATNLMSMQRDVHIY